MEKPEYEVVGVSRDLSSIGDLNRRPDYIEFQLDHADNPEKQLQEYEGNIPLIVSSSSSETAETGASLNEETIINALAYDFVEMVDLLADNLTPPDTLSVELERSDVDIIATYRDTHETPSTNELSYHIEECADLGDIAKIITYANSSDDALHFLEALNSASQSGLRVAGYCLGDAGKHTQAMAVFYGSQFCYGVIDSASQDFADSQFELSQLLKTLHSVIHGGDEVELMDVLKGNFS